MNLFPKSPWAYFRPLSIIVAALLTVGLYYRLDRVSPGTRLAIGSAVIEVTEVPHTGCAKFTERFGLEAMKFVNSPLGRQLHLRGINAKVVQAGTIRTGDLVGLEKAGAV